MSLLEKWGLGAVALGVFVLLGLSGNEKEQVRDKILEQLEVAVVEPISLTEVRQWFAPEPSFVLAEVNQKVNELKKKVVEWPLTVYDVVPAQEHTKVLIYLDEKQSSVDVRLYARTGEELSQLHGLKEGDNIRVRGMVQSVSAGSIKINPAFLLH